MNGKCDLTKSGYGLALLNCVGIVIRSRYILFMRLRLRLGSPNNYLFIIAMAIELLDHKSWCPNGAFILNSERIGLSSVDIDNVMLNHI